MDFDRSDVITYLVASIQQVLDICLQGICQIQIELQVIIIVLIQPIEIYHTSLGNKIYSTVTRFNVI